MAILLWHKTGPLMQYREGMLVIEDLNPERKMTWAVTRFELLRLGLQCLRAAFAP
jgi:hypothetical protein